MTSPAPRLSVVPQLFQRIDWLIVLLVSWLLPLGLVRGLKVTYFNSLLFWLVPIVCLLPRFLRLTHPGSRRRRALAWATVQIVVLGVLLDFVFGHRILQFASPASGTYIGYLPAIGMQIPIEEVLFYLLSPAAILLVYFWCDEYFLSLYNKQARRLAMDPERPLIRVSGRVLVAAVAGLALGIFLKTRWSTTGGWLPFYFTFLVIVALVPAVLLYDSVKDLINWQALTLTILYIVATSIIWEVTLAIPRRWWGYRPEAMLGKMVEPWTADPTWPFPIEAALVSISAPFACVFTYEAVKAYRYHPAATRLKRLLSV